jgi:hypothetical protein
MKKKIVLFSFVLVLVCAVLTGCAVAAFNKGDDNDAAQDDINLSTTSSATVPYLRDVSANKVFYVSASDPAATVKVVDNIGNKVDVNYEATSAGNYKVAPAAAYEAGVTYSILLSGDAEFVGEYYGNKSINFTIEKAEVYKVEYNDDVIVLGADGDKFNFDAANYQIVTNNNAVAIGGYVVVPVAEGNIEVLKAYYVEDIVSDGGLRVLKVSDPGSLDEVFEDININKKFVLSDGVLTFREDELIAACEEMFPSLSGITDYFKVELPRKEIDKDNNKAYLDIKIKFQYKGIEFFILIQNDITMNPSVNYSVIPFSAQVGADLNIVTTTTLGIAAGYSIDKTWAVDEILNKINESNEASFTKTLAKLAHWEVAYGPLALAYDLDIVLTISLKGELDAGCVITTNYSVGAYYVDGDFKAWCDKGESSGFKMKDIELYGVIGAKIGFNNSLELKIIQIARVGIEVELGFYLDVWGCVKVDFNNGNFSEVSAAAGIYGDFGFYVDIRVKAAAGIPGIDWANISKAWTIFSKKWSIFTFGNPELDICYTERTKTLVLSGNQGAMPDMEVKVYNMISRTTYTKTVPYAENKVVLPATSYFTVDASGILTVKAGAPEAFGNGEDIDQEVLYSYDGHGLNKIEGSVFVVRVRNMPYAVDSIASFYKDDVVLSDVIFTLNMLDATYEGVEGINSQYVEYNDGTLTVKKMALVSQDSGRIEFYVNTSKNVITLWIDIYGNLGVKSIGRGTLEDPYVIYGRDQLDALSSEAAANDYYQGVYFRLANDISYSGKEFTPIAKFQGVFNGNGHAITDLSINSLSGGYAAFILVNEGTIRNLSVSANMSFNSGSIYAGVIAGLNAGVIENCTANGSITASYKCGLNSPADFKIGGAVAINNGTVKNVSSYTGITVNTTGVNNKSNVYVAGVIGSNSGNITDSAYYGTINASVGGLQKLHKSDLSN